MREIRSYRYVPLNQYTFTAKYRVELRTRLTCWGSLADERRNTSCVRLDADWNPKKFKWAEREDVAWVGRDAEQTRDRNKEQQTERRHCNYRSADKACGKLNLVYQCIGSETIIRDRIKRYKAVSWAEDLWVRYGPQWDLVVKIGQLNTWLDQIQLGEVDNWTIDADSKS